MEFQADYIEKMLAAIVGIELTLTSLEGKWESQNRDGVIASLCERSKTGTAALPRRDRPPPALRPRRYTRAGDTLSSC